MADPRWRIQDGGSKMADGYQLRTTVLVAIVSHQIIGCESLVFFWFPLVKILYDQRIKKILKSFFVEI